MLGGAGLQACNQDWHGVASAAEVHVKREDWAYTGGLELGKAGPSTPFAALRSSRDDKALEVLNERLDDQRP
jgi:hypothetical protein